MVPHIAIAVTALIFAVITTSSAAAFPERSRFEPYATSNNIYEPDLRRSYVQPDFTGCPMSSAKEGNAEQQNFPVKQYGQTSGGYRC
ncbi:hypothetical protein [Methylorubrum extorquens]|uniref:Secreted protein n=1 Tax=Methylorubrum extorquens (strain CM4 / NCIMB 13688) TaxID=440085 RepID=B7KRR3_METC4|nr:hypothetical protein [Methylorubrum extorquens]ACK85590.1 conserved hypothetical protein [Methylorubrum extorquens CM4]